MRIRDLRTNEEGNELIEFGLVAWLLVMLLFGVVDFGGALYAYNFVGYAARAGTRYATVRGAACTSWLTACPASAADVQTYVRNYAAGGITASNLTVTTTWSPNNQPGSAVSVQVQYAFTFPVPLPYLSGFTMTSTARTVISQ